MSKSCFNCGHHNLDCFETFDDTTCYDYFAITAEYDPNRAIRNSLPKRRATEYEELKSQLDRIEKKIDDLLSCPISAQEERANRGEDAKCDRIISDWKNKYNPELKEMFDPDEPDINHTDWN